MANLATLLGSVVLLGSSGTIAVGAIFAYASIFQGAEFPPALVWAIPLAALTGALFSLTARRKLAVLLSALFLLPLVLVSLLAMFLGTAILFNALSASEWTVSLGYGAALLGGGYALNWLLGITARAFGLKDA